jgi:hypothetical protein
MDWVTVVGFLLTGGVSKALVDQLIRGWRQRQLAIGGQETLAESLKRSRLWWMEHAYRARRLIIESGGEPPQINEGDDPYLVWESRQQQQQQQQQQQ